MRGALIQGVTKALTAWIIPADAGSTRTDEDRADFFEDHPRGCGEHQATTAEAMANQGSSPRMRGAHGLNYLDIPEGRIIPADAGSTEQVLRRAYQQEDHPRGCGEHLLGLWVADLIEGSSPRMRGARCLFPLM